MANNTKGVYYRANTDALTTLEAQSLATADSVPVGPNYVINGGFDIWQRGTSLNVADGGYGPDRLRRSSNGTGTYNFSRQSFTPGSAPVSGYEGEFFCRYVISSAAAQGYNTLQQPIENVRTLAGQIGTFSIWLKTTSGTFSVTPELHQYFGAGGSPDVVIGGSAWTVTTSWQRFTVTFNVPSIAGKTIGSNNWVAIDLKLPLNANLTLDLWGMQFEEGSVATPFRRNANSIQGELAACQRYYYRLTGTGVYSPLVMMQWTSSTASSAVVFPKVTMRVTPFAVDYANVAEHRYGSSQASISAITLDSAQSGTDAFGLSVTHASIAYSSGQLHWIATSAANGYIGFNAEL